MNLIIFDIDGTLTKTNELDSKCFSRAIKDILQLEMLNSDWTSYRYSTDSGLITEIYENNFQRLPQESEIETVRNCFIDYLKQEWQKDTSLISPLCGAEKIFEKIHQLNNWHIGIATGGWKRSALFKLDSAGIPHNELPKAYADDHIERAEIIKIATQQSKSLHNVKRYHRMVYVGDRLWDQRAAQQLNIEFIGVGDQFTETSSSQQLFIKDYSCTTLLEYLTSHLPN